MRSALQQTLRNGFEGAEVLAAATPAEARSVLGAQPTDLLLLDLFLQAQSAQAPFSLATRLAAEFPDTCIAVISASDSPEYARQALNLGLRAYLPKSIDGPMLVSALRLVLAGGCYFPASLNARPAAGAPGSVVRQPPAMPLTVRQSEILDLLITGQPNKNISRLLNISVQTVKDHVTVIMGVMQVENRTQLAMAALELDRQFPTWRSKVRDTEG